MKALLCLALAAAPILPVRAGVAPRAPSSEPAVDLTSRFSLIGQDYKHAVVLPDSIFNPFRIQAATGLTGAGKPDDADASNESIAEAIGRRRITGLLLAPDPGNDRVIIGDRVFGLGDPLEFFDRDRGGAVPLAKGVTVILRGIRTDSLAFDVGLGGEAPHRLDLSLRDFWRP